MTEEVSMKRLTIGFTVPILNQEHLTSYEIKPPMSLLPQFLVLLQFSYLKFCTCTDTLTSSYLIKDHEAIISNNTNFKLGFFSPANSTSRYVGISYNTPVQTAIWVANRDKPLNDTFGTVAISGDGNLAVLDGQQQLIWSSNVLNSMANSSAQLLDSGNLVLLDKSGRTLWQSFERPSDSFLQNMRLAVSNTQEKSLVTSWKSPSNPSVGFYSFGINPPNMPQFVAWNGSNPYWRSGLWNGQIFIGVPNMNSVYSAGFDLIKEDDGSTYLTFSYTNTSTRTYFFLDSEGNLSQRYWYDGKEDWETIWTAIKDECDVYGKCGAFGSCDIQDSRLCSCLEGFEPRNLDEWSRKNWTGGCQRRTLLQCERNTSISNQDKKDGFLKLTTVKLPDFPELSYAQDIDCGSKCLNSCSCVAYAYTNGIGCMQWSGNLIDIAKFGGSGGVDLYVRVAYSELDKKKNMDLIVAITVIIGSISVVLITFFAWKCMGKGKGIVPVKSTCKIRNYDEMICLNQERRIEVICCDMEEGRIVQSIHMKARPRRN
ncbi:hypothetical protein RJ639_009083 [Escallonia herrerae]|uniref:Uncharacterized protein n=1 Tax=Escallonia herrerae TaxID=1293975 RepID=A0AA88VS30_9ASTE|nr:hypothetical protein RJ639_009083 [Escallonia herrerae]